MELIVQPIQAAHHRRTGLARRVIDLFEPGPSSRCCTSQPVLAGLIHLLVAIFLRLNPLGKVFTLQIDLRLKLLTLLLGRSLGQFRLQLQDTVIRLLLKLNALLIALCFKTAHAYGGCLRSVLLTLEQ